MTTQKVIKLLDEVRAVEIRLIEAPIRGASRKNLNCLQAKFDRLQAILSSIRGSYIPEEEEVEE